MSGDIGLGVYLFNSLDAAQSYLARGGWDGGSDPSASVILEIRCDPDLLQAINPDPAWSDPERYDAVRVFLMEDDDATWKSEMRLLDMPDENFSHDL